MLNAIGASKSTDNLLNDIDTLIEDYSNSMSDTDTDDNTYSIDSESTFVSDNACYSDNDFEFNPQHISDIYSKICEIKSSLLSRLSTMNITINNVLSLIEYIYNIDLYTKHITYGNWIDSIDRLPCTITKTTLLYLLRLAKGLSYDHLHSTILFLLKTCHPSIAYHLIISMEELQYHNLTVRYNILSILTSMRYMCNYQLCDIEYSTDCYCDPLCANKICCSNCNSALTIDIYSVLPFDSDITMDRSIYEEYCKRLTAIHNLNTIDNSTLLYRITLDAYIIILCRILGNVNQHMTNSLEDRIERFTTLFDTITGGMDVYMNHSVLCNVDTIITLLHVYDVKMSRYQVLNSIHNIDNDTAHMIVYEWFGMTYGNIDNSVHMIRVINEITLFIRNLFQRYEFKDGYLRSKTDYNEYFVYEFNTFLRTLASSAKLYGYYHGVNGDTIQTEYMCTQQKIMCINGITKYYKQLHVFEELVGESLCKIDICTASTPCMNCDKILFIPRVISLTMCADIITCYINRIDKTTLVMGDILLCRRDYALCFVLESYIKLHKCVCINDKPYIERLITTISDTFGHVTDCIDDIINTESSVIIKEIRERSRIQTNDCINRFIVNNINNINNTHNT